MNVKSNVKIHDPCLWVINFFSATIPIFIARLKYKRNHLNFYAISLQLSKEMSKNT